MFFKRLFNVPQIYLFTFLEFFNDALFIKNHQIEFGIFLRIVQYNKINYSYKCARTILKCTAIKFFL
jgi:hypothetical protein